MLVLIDESGCTGFKLNKNSTQYFVVSMVIFADFSEAEKTSATIEKLRKDFRLKTEFKFCKTSSEIKDSFFQTVSHHNFKVMALIVDKKAIYSHHLQQHGEDFYNFFIRHLMTYDNNRLVNATVKMDKRGNKALQKAMRSYLSNYLRKGAVKKITAAESHRDNLIQLADMVVGAIARSCNINRKDNHRWLDMLKNKNRVENIWYFQ